jgi:enamine deaminase RidA (YjgF/YER057c/UK114 family)
MSKIQRAGVAKRWCSAASANGIVFVGGHTPKQTRAAALGDQTREVLQLLDQTREEMGSRKDAILGATIYLSDISKAGEMNAVWDEWVAPGNPAARTCIEVKMAPGIDVEISATALQI